MKNVIELADYTSPKSEAMVRASITRKIEELVHIYPKITIAQLMAFIFRSKGEVMGAPWNWSDSKEVYTIGSSNVLGRKGSYKAKFNSMLWKFSQEPNDHQKFVTFLKSRYKMADAKLQSYIGSMI